MSKILCIYLSRKFWSSHLWSIFEPKGYLWKPRSLWFSKGLKLLKSIFISRISGLVQRYCLKMGKSFHKRFHQRRSWECNLWLWIVKLSDSKLIIKVLCQYHQRDRLLEERWHSNKILPFRFAFINPIKAGSFIIPTQILLPDRSSNFEDVE